MSKKIIEHARPSESFWVRNRKSGGYLLKKTIGNKAYKFIRFLLLFGLCFMIVQPLLSKISVSFMTELDLYDSTIISIPRHLTVENYTTAALPALLNYGKSLTNTLVISLCVSLLQVASATLVGYGFARFNFPLKKFWFFAVILTVVIPPQTISTALHLTFSHFNPLGIVGMFNGGEEISLLSSKFYISLFGLTHVPLPYFLMSATCMGLKNGLYIYMIRQFFAGVPQSLEEAAYVDGCSTFKTFWKVILPDAVPILVSCFLFAFVWQWTDTFYTKMFIRDTSLPMLSMKLSGIAEALSKYLESIRGTGNVATMGHKQQFVSTGTLMVIAPLLLLYLFAQKGFVESISSTGLK
ncbi:MAG: carbohydrate ABC transporter permease [Clostridia bacterium]|nr:carbohydrate ABC transporter permease [Clostridia bacterium]